MVADKLGISEEDAGARIIAEIRRNSDKKTADATGPVHDWRVRSILGCPNLNCTGSANDPEYSNHEYNAGLVGDNMEAWNASQAILGGGSTLREQREANNPLGTAALGFGMIAYGVAASTSPGVGLRLVGVGAGLGFASNGVVQGLSGQPFDPFSFGMAGLTGSATAGVGLVPAIIVNTGGAIAGAGVSGSDPNGAALGAVAGAVVGYPIGSKIQGKLDEIFNPWYAQRWLSLGSGVSKYIPQSLLPAFLGGVGSSVGQ